MGNEEKILIHIRVDRGVVLQEQKTVSQFSLPVDSDFLA